MTEYDVEQSAKIWPVPVEMVMDVDMIGQIVLFAYDFISSRHLSQMKQYSIRLE